MMPLWVATLDVVVGVVLVTLWYLWFLNYNRKKAFKILRWISAASAAQGRLTHVRWITPSRLAISMWLRSHCFHEAQFLVDLHGREMPLNWLLRRVRNVPETLTFEADLDCPPSFNLEVHNYRWSKLLAPKQDREKIALARTVPIVLTTRGDWQQDLTHMLRGLLASRDCNFQTVRFRRSSPHFSATVPLPELQLDGECASEFFEALRDLATSASAAMF